MDDPWAVKSVRQSGQYVSCMKINGVPLLPPVLSKECREEMQYYKLLAKEVEKRISYLKPYLISDEESIEDNITLEITKQENIDQVLGEVQAEFDIGVDTAAAVITDVQDTSSTIPGTEHDGITSNTTVVKIDNAISEKSPKYIIDLSVSINETNTNIPESDTKRLIDVPERDYNCTVKHKELPDAKTDNKEFKDIVNFSVMVDDSHIDPFLELNIKNEGPSSLSSKSFTGSLNDIHTESIKETHVVPKLIRQSSYTILTPSPQLLAHLEVQSLNTGVEMTSISMSESMSNLYLVNKKRRSWDLESAKEKWSSMALELNEKNSKMVEAKKNHNSRSTMRKIEQPTIQRTRSLAQESGRRYNSNSTTAKKIPHSDPIQKTKKNVPIKNTNNQSLMNNPTLSKENNQTETQPTQQSIKLISGAEDPARKVRELYEKIQKQQLSQMAALVEKQKKEQLLLQQLFEEQNNLLYKQLKTICPKSPVEVKEAWADSSTDVNQGPVSLSQLINHKTPEQSTQTSPISSTLTETNNFINQCDNILKKSRDISSSLKKPCKILNPNRGNFQSSSPKSHMEGSRTRTHSPNNRISSTSRKLKYDTSGASTDRECEPILTDRTNDTMADLNVTFPSDTSDGCNNNTTAMSHCEKDLTVIHRTLATPTTVQTGCYTTQRPNGHITGNALNLMKSKYSSNSTVQSKEQLAASRIVAYAKGYLVRRLMRTERVQTTVQTIRDALICALQLHQDREGIRGADVDLHRRLIQQITAACYSLHETFITSSPTERCAMIFADRARRQSLAARQSPKPFRQTDL